MTDTSAVAVLAVSDSVVVLISSSLALASRAATRDHSGSRIEAGRDAGTNGRFRPQTPASSVSLSGCLRDFACTVLIALGAHVMMHGHGLFYLAITYKVGNPTACHGDS